MLQRGFNVWYILLSLLFGLAANVVRDCAGSSSLSRIAEPKPKVINAVLTTLGTYTVNMALPRAGEIWRCAEEGRYERLPFAQLLGTLSWTALWIWLPLCTIFSAVLIGANEFLYRFFADNRSAFSLPDMGVIFGSMALFGLRCRADSSVGELIAFCATLSRYVRLSSWSPKCCKVCTRSGE